MADARPHVRFRELASPTKFKLTVEVSTINAIKIMNCVIHVCEVTSM